LTGPQLTAWEIFVTLGYGEEAITMGDVYLELTVANTHDPERQQDISFLVDTGVLTSSEAYSDTVLHRR
jgi:hypothetical protein